MSVRLTVDAGVATVTLHRPEVRNAFGADMRVRLGEASSAAPPTTRPPSARRHCPDRSGRSRSPWSPRSTGTPSGSDRRSRCSATSDSSPATRATAWSRSGGGSWATPTPTGAAPDRRRGSRGRDPAVGRTFDGDEAHALGICSRVLPNDEVLGAALELAGDIAANTAPLSAAHSKRLLWDSWHLTPEEVERRETAAHHRLMGAPDATEGVLAFLERRPPVWQGRVSRDLR